uniref:tRNA_int_end_N2 domain-containing protein n=2 Tax=Caenorhabditis tropicalis TaxID=1561998 RepID=A0A1I7TPQ5_9PELO
MIEIFRKKTVEIIYSPGCSTLKVRKAVGKHLESMGIPSKSGYELFPEEAVYMMETGSATILTLSGIEMNLLEAFSILESNAISMSKYEIYKQVKSTGLVVLRPRKHTIELERLRLVKNEIHQRFTEKSCEMLAGMSDRTETGVPNAESFPCYSNQNGQFSIEMKLLHTDSSLVNFLSFDLLESFPCCETVQHLQPPSHRSFKSCRPSCWPLGRQATNWSVYRFQAEQFRQNMLLEKLRKLRPSSNAELRREKTTIENVDFHVFSPASFSHRLPARPLFSLICHSATGLSLKTTELSELRNVVIALEEAGKVNYVKLSGTPVALKDYLC